MSSFMLCYIFLSALLLRFIIYLNKFIMEWYFKVIFDGRGGGGFTW